MVSRFLASLTAIVVLTGVIPVDAAEIIDEPVPLPDIRPAKDWSNEPPLIAEIEDGIGPGNLLRIEYPDGAIGGCTANFIWVDQEERRHLGTAGHCLMPSGTTATHGPGADYDASGIQVSVGVRECMFHPSTFVATTTMCLMDTDDCVDTTPVCMVELGPPYVRLGAVSYARQEGSGCDFGLIEIPEDLYHLLRPTLPSWGGPTGSGTAEEGDLVLQYGHGFGYDLNPTTRRRGGHVLDDPLPGTSRCGHPAFSYFGPGGPGDSGSPIILGAKDEGDTLWHGTDAVAVLTHGRQIYGGGVTIILGTTMSGAKHLACEAGLEIRLWGIDDTATTCRDSGEI